MTEKRHRRTKAEMAAARATENSMFFEDKPVPGEIVVVQKRHRRTKAEMIEAMSKETHEDLTMHEKLHGEMVPVEKKRHRRSKDEIENDKREKKREIEKKAFEKKMQEERKAAEKIERENRKIENEKRKAEALLIKEEAEIPIFSANRERFDTDILIRSLREKYTKHSGLCVADMVLQLVDSFEHLQLENAKLRRGL
jgi:hypothetical protein